MVEIRARLHTVDRMRLARIELQIERFAGGDQGIDQLERILHVDVVIARAMRDQQTAVQVGRRLQNRAGSVTLRVCRGMPM
jgi:hypothetical protein